MQFDRRNFLVGALSAGALNAAAGALAAQESDLAAVVPVRVAAQSRTWLLVK